MIIYIDGYTSFKTSKKGAFTNRVGSRNHCYSSETGLRLGVDPSSDRQWLNANQDREQNQEGISWKMTNAPLHTPLEKVASGAWGIVAALDSWIGGEPHSRRYRQRKELQTTRAQQYTRSLIA